MQRLNKTAHAGLGLTLFLFLGLAIVPFSLRAAGVQVSISPRLSAAIDVWRQIADALGSGYQSGTEFAREPAVANSEVACPHQKLACVTGQKEVLQTSADAVDSHSKEACLQRPRRAITSKLNRTKRIEPALAIDDVNASFELKAFSELKLEKLPREKVFWQSFQRRELIERLPVPQRLRVLFRMNSTFPVVKSPVRCKVQAATSGEESNDTNYTLHEPDHCDL